MSDDILPEYEIPENLKLAHAAYKTGDTRRGDNHFADEYPTLERKIRRFTMRETSRRDLQEDISAIAMNKVWAYTKRYDAPGDPLVKRIVQLTVQNSIQRGKRHEHFAYEERDDRRSTTIEFVDTLADEQRLDLLQRRARVLNPLWGRIIKAYTEGHHTLDQIATHLKVPGGTIRRSVMDMRAHSHKITKQSTTPVDAFLKPRPVTTATNDVDLRLVFDRELQGRMIFAPDSSATAT